jgi:hypothetical protein
MATTKLRLRLKFVTVLLVLGYIESLDGIALSLSSFAPTMPKMKCGAESLSRSAFQTLAAHQVSGLNEIRWGMAGQNPSLAKCLPAVVAT